MASISYDKQAISTLIQIAECLETHPFFRELLEHCDIYDTEELERTFEKQLASFIKNSVINSEKNYIITHDDIVKETDNIIKIMLFRCTFLLPSEDSKVTDGYPLLLLSDICGSTKKQAHIIGECVKSFIKSRCADPIPKELHPVIESRIPLVNHPRSPLLQEELTAIHRYLDSSKNIYVHMLLQCLREFTIQQQLMTETMTLEQIISICKAPWFYLFFTCMSQYMNN